MNEQKCAISLKNEMSSISGGPPRIQSNSIVAGHVIFRDKTEVDNFVRDFVVGNPSLTDNKAKMRGES